MEEKGTRWEISGPTLVLVKLGHHCSNGKGGHQIISFYTKLNPLHFSSHLIFHCRTGKGGHRTEVHWEPVFFPSTGSFLPKREGWAPPKPLVIFLTDSIPSDVWSVTNSVEKARVEIKVGKWITNIYKIFTYPSSFNLLCNSFVGVNCEPTTPISIFIDKYLKCLAGNLADVIVVQLKSDQPLEVIKHSVIHNPKINNT